MPEFLSTITFGTLCIIDAQRDQITHEQTNKLLEFVEWSGKKGDRPMAYTSIERSFFKEFLYKKPLNTPLDEGLEQGLNPRQLERKQLVQMMSLFAEVFFVNKWDPDVGGRKLENRLKKGEVVSEGHLRAWRIARVEVLANVLRWVRLVITNYFAYRGKMIQDDRLLHTPLPDEVWDRMQNFLENLADLPCWIDKGLGMTVFGPKQNLDYWEQVFQTGSTPTQIKVLMKPLDLHTMIQYRQ